MKPYPLTLNIKRRVFNGCKDRLFVPGSKYFLTAKLDFSSPNVLVSKACATVKTLFFLNAHAYLYFFTFYLKFGRQETAFPVPTPPLHLNHKRRSLFSPGLSYLYIVPELPVDKQ